MQHLKKKKKSQQPIIYEPKKQLPQLTQPSCFAKAQFLTSAPTLKDCPPETGVEIAFVGRSNSGKSSAINQLTRPNLARTSKTPGRTQLINFFSLEEPTKRLVDLPGYGYAKVPQAIRREWGKHLGAYVSERQCLVAMVMMMDVRHPMTDFDLQLLKVAAGRQLPVHLLLTKADKLKRGPARQQLLQVEQELAQLTGNFSLQLFSALKGEGLSQAWQQLETWFNQAALESTCDPLPEGD